MDSLPISFEQIWNIGIYVVILMLIWGAIRMVLRLTKKVFQFGCMAIILLGAGLLILQIFGGA
jgi:hypothetical protein